MNIMKQVWKELFRIPIDVCKAFENIVFSHRKSKSDEEKVVENARWRDATIQNQQESLIYDARVKRAQRSEIQDLRNLIEKLKKENRDLRNRIRSLYRENLDLRERLKRKR